MNLREELIQVAAVAVAIIEDLDYGQAKVSGIGGHTDDILLEVLHERVNQDQKWGPQHHDPAIWLLILMEEVGEAVDEISSSPSPAISSLLYDMGHLGASAKRKLDRLFTKAEDIKIGGTD